MDVQSYILGALTGVVIVAFLPFAALFVIAVVEILLTPSVAHAPEIDLDEQAARRETQEELLRKRDEIDAALAEGRELLGAGQ